MLKLISLFLFSSSFLAYSSALDTLNIKRKNAVIITQSVSTVGALVGLHELWYKDFQKTNFQFKDDSQHWLQMDKAGHLHSAYHLTRLSAELMSWSGESKKNQRLYGAVYAQTFLTTIEVFDGFSKQWGFSWTDLSANMLGTGLYLSQDLLWQDQRIIPKFSFHQTRFAQQRPEVLGYNMGEQMIKDYNGQTYWLSFNMHAFVKNEKIPKFLNLALGYGAEGMLTATPKDVFDQRYRKFFISLDIDFQRIETKKLWLKALFSVINVLKLPFPTLELSTEKGVKAHLIYF